MASVNRPDAPEMAVTAKRTVEARPFDASARDFICAVELVSAVYEDALRRHGVLTGTAAKIKADAYANLARALPADGANWSWLSAAEATDRLRAVCPGFPGFETIKRAPTGDFVRTQQPEKHGPVYYHSDDIDALCKLAEGMPEFTPEALILRRAEQLAADATDNAGGLL